MSKTTLFDSRIKKYAYREAAQLYGELGRSTVGLSPEQVERQRQKYGSNCFGSRSSDTMLRRLRRAFLLYVRKDRRRLVWWGFLRFSEVFRGAVDIFSGNGLYYSIRASCGGGGPYMVLPKEDGV